MATPLPVDRNTKPFRWIYRVASNEAFNFLKRKGIEQKALQVIGPLDELSDTDDIAYNELKRIQASCPGKCDR